MATINAINNTITNANFTVPAGTITSSGNISTTAGNLLLPTTSSTVGQLQINATRFAHSFGTNNTFLGSGAGNFTTSGTGGNTIVGQGAGVTLDTGSLNTGVGRASLKLVTTGAQNTGIGNGALENSTGSFSTSVGSLCLQAVTTGNRNVGLGYLAGSSYTGSESHNIVIGNTGVAAESNTIRIGTTGSGGGQQNRCFLGGINGATITPVGYVAVATDGQLANAATTNNAVQVGNSTGTFTSLAVGATNQVLVGNTGANPSWTGTPTVTSISFGGSALSTFTDWTSWTPTLIGASTAGTTTYTTQFGTYSRIGNIVTVQFNIVITAATGTGSITIGGLPFTISNTTNYIPLGTVAISAAGIAWPASTTMLTLYGILNTTTALILASGSSVGSAFVQIANTAATVIGTLTYRV